MAQQAQLPVPGTNRPQHERGQSTIEFALSVGFLMLLIMAFLDMGRAVYIYSVVSEAAQEGARYAIINPNDTTGIVNTARNYAVGLDPALVNVTRTFPSNSQIEIVVTYQFRPVTPMIGSAIGNNGVITLSNTARMLIER